MKKTVYHGSDHIIERPKYGYGKIYNDYGVGFYCTENQNMAKEWGVSADKNGYANRYEYARLYNAPLAYDFVGKSRI